MNHRSNLPAISIIVPAMLACVLWGSSFPFTKITLRYTEPYTVAGLRFMLAGLLLLPFCGHPKRWIHEVRSNLKMVLRISLFQTLLLYALFYLGMSLVRGAQAAIAVGSSPLLAALLAHAMLHNDKLTPRKIASIGVGIAGIVIISLSVHPWGATGLRELCGILLLIASELSAAYGNIVFVKRNQLNMNPIALNSVQMGLGGMVLLLLSAIIAAFSHRTLQIPMEPTFFLSMLWLAIISAVAFSIWFHLLKTVKVSALNIWKFLIPVVGATLSWILLPNEHPDRWAILGMCCIGLSIITFNLGEMEKV